MTQKIRSNTQAVMLRVMLGAALVIGVGYLLATHWHTVRSSAQVARGASVPWLVLALLLMVITFMVAAGIYGVLALHRLQFRQTLLVEISTAFVNRLLPSGIGGLGLHGLYLHGRKHTVAEATVVVSVNNLLGMVAHLSLLAVVILSNHAVITQFKLGGLHLNWRIGLAASVLLGMLVAIPAVRRKLRSFINNLLASVYKLTLKKLLVAFILALVLTVTYTSILGAVSHALGLHLGILEVFIVFSVGMLASTATPTPGGLVGAEAGLFAGFVGYGVGTPEAGAAVLLYRLVTYWLPLAPGVVAFVFVRRRRLL